MGSRKTSKGGTRSSKVRGIQFGITNSLSASRIAMRKKDDERKAFVAFNGEYYEARLFY